MPYQDACPVCHQSLTGHSLLLDRNVWLHAHCWQPSWVRNARQTEQRTPMPVAGGKLTR